MCLDCSCSATSTTRLKRIAMQRVEQVRAARGLLERLKSMDDGSEFKRVFSEPHIFFFFFFFFSFFFFNIPSTTSRVSAPT